MAMLYALDRHAAAPDIRAALDTHDYVLLGPVHRVERGLRRRPPAPERPRRVRRLGTGDRDRTVRPAGPARPPAAAGPVDVAAARSAHRAPNRNRPRPRQLGVGRRPAVPGGGGLRRPGGGRLAGPMARGRRHDHPGRANGRTWRNRRLPEPATAFLQSHWSADQIRRPQAARRSPASMVQPADRRRSATVPRPSPASRGPRHEPRRSRTRGRRDPCRTTTSTPRGPTSPTSAPRLGQPLRERRPAPAACSPTTRGGRARRPSRPAAARCRARRTGPGRGRCRTRRRAGTPRSAARARPGNRARPGRRPRCARHPARRARRG